MVSVCIETVFTELGYEERVRRIGDLGFRGVEIWSIDGTWDGARINRERPKDAARLARACREANVELVGLVMNATDGSEGAPVSLAGRSLFEGQFARVSRFMADSGCRNAVVMPGPIDPRLSPAEMERNLEGALERVLPGSERLGITLLLEPLNTVVDHPGFALARSADAFRIVRAMGSDRLKVLYDLYHMQIMEGNLIDTILGNLRDIAHLHAAGVPGRAEIEGCELNYPEIVLRAERAGYGGYVGLEYFPTYDHAQSLARQLRYLLPR